MEGGREGGVGGKTLAERKRMKFEKLECTIHVLLSSRRRSVCRTPPVCWGV